MRLIPVLALLFLVACAPPPDPAAILVPPRAQAQTAEEIAFATRLFNDIQPSSIAERREYCGLIGVDAAGNYIATNPVRGRASSCLPPDPRDMTFTVLASYHTHGAWHPDFITEIPSFSDIRTDIEDGTDGYVATPGGRLWYIDARAKFARQLCGRNCLIDDPGYRRNPRYEIEQTYTLDDLRAY